MKAIHRKTKSKRIMLYNTVNTAEDSIGKLYKNCEIFGFTNGQFSSIDIIEMLIKKCNKPNIIIGTWTAAHASIKKAKNLLENELNTIRWLLDESFLNRQPEYAKLLIDKFGIECIRTLSIHAKFTVVYDQNMYFVMRTSMNLNQNKRIENFEISENKEFAEFFIKMTDEIFSRIDIKDVTKRNIKKIDKIGGWDNEDLFNFKL